MDFANFWFSFTMTVKFILHIDISFTVIGAYNFRNKVQCTRLLSCMTVLLVQRKDNYQALEHKQISKYKNYSTDTCFYTDTYWTANEPSLDPFLNKSWKHWGQVGVTAVTERNKTSTILFTSFCCNSSIVAFVIFVSYSISKQTRVQSTQQHVHRKVEDKCTMFCWWMLMVFVIRNCKLIVN